MLAAFAERTLRPSAPWTCTKKINISCLHGSTCAHWSWGDCLHVEGKYRIEKLTCLMVFHASTGMSIMRMLPAAADAHMVCDVECLWERGAGGRQKGKRRLVENINSNETDKRGAFNNSNVHATYAKIPEQTSGYLYLAVERACLRSRMCLRTW